MEMKCYWTLHYGTCDFSVLFVKVHFSLKYLLKDLTQLKQMLYLLLKRASAQVFSTYHIGEQGRLKRVCTYAQTH